MPLYIQNGINKLLSIKYDSYVSEQHNSNSDMNVKMIQALILN